jgi:hypothetical protein
VVDFKPLLDADLLLTPLERLPFFLNPFNGLAVVPVPFPLRKGDVVEPPFVRE